MLRITISKNGEGAVAYFTSGLSKEDYFFNEHEVESKWQGLTAEYLHLYGKVTKNDFSKLVNNIHPHTGKRLTLRQNSERRAGCELCFNAPKSASIAFAITRDKLILDAHTKAVKLAMQEIEEDMQTQANKGKHKYYETTGNIVYASFNHFTSRPVEETRDNATLYVPDCHLHTHSFVFNCTWNADKKRFQAIEMGNIHKLAPYYEALYHSHFSKALADAGYEIELTPERWEIKGISRKTIEKFSKRTLLIEETARIKGVTDAKKKSELGAKTRVKKNKSVEENKLYQLWEQRLTSEDLNRIYHLKHNKQARNNDNTISPADAIEKSLAHHLERSSAVAEKRALATAMASGYGIFKPVDVKKALSDKVNILSAFFSTVKYITTREMVLAEDQMITFACRSKGSMPPVNPTYKPKQDYLNEEQRNAISHLLSSNDQVSILLGAAGVGKTSLLTEVLYGVEQAGKQLLAFAPSAAASRGVLREKGFINSDTITALLQNKELQEKTKNNVILVDEAGMVGTETMLALLHIAQQNNARIILSGDPKQHSSVNAGDALRQLIEKAQITPAAVNTIVRQKKNQPYLNAIQELAKGNTFAGFNKIDKMGAVIELEDKVTREQQLASAYIQSLQLGRSALVVSPTHAEGQSITEAIRERLKSKKMITGKEQQFTTQQNLSLTDAQKKDAVQYAEGMVVQFQQNTKGGYKAGCKYTIVEKDNHGQVIIQSTLDNKKMVLPLHETERFQVYKTRGTPIAKGDLICITQNGQSLEGSKIHNGQTYTVNGFTKTGDIKLSNGKTLDKDYRNFTYGHVVTSFASQGKDAQDVYIAQSALSMAASNEKQFYVSASRGTEKIFIYTDDKTELKKAITRNTDRMTAKDVSQQHHRQRTFEKRVRYYQAELKRNEGYEQTISKQPERAISSSGRTRAFERE